jgi:hypothetical protein
MSDSSVFPDSVELFLEARQPCRRQCEPVTCGLPLPRYWLSSPAQLELCDAQGGPVTLQTRVLERWPDGSIRWLLLDWQATVDGSASYRLSKSPTPTGHSEEGIQIARQSSALVIETGQARFVVGIGLAFPFAGYVPGVGTGEERILANSSLVDEANVGHQARVRTVQVMDDGPLRACVRVVGEWVSAHGRSLAELEAYLHFFAGSATVRLSVTIRNPRKARHPGGLWDLGNGGSIYLREAELRFGLENHDPTAVIRYSTELDQPFESCGPGLEIYQDSSGGQNWQCSNHLNRRHIVPHCFRGYRVRTEGREQFGLRATPVVAVESGRHFLAAAVPDFWQNFPKAIEATSASVAVSLFPRQAADLHEIQGGEQKTHEVTVAFGRDRVTAEPLDWCRTPLLPQATPEWYCPAAGHYLVPRAQDPNSDYLKLVDAAIDGDDTFAHKREVIDEYGWRHFGEIYGDHEGVFHRGSRPLVSHYNNQYDAVAGFAYQFLRSGEQRWWQQMRELAAHVIDIDIYHCDRDKTAYNRGLFWHTYHYVDADTGAHRSYPRAAGVCGGGPSCEHNYTTGLMLTHFLTGDPRARQTVLDLAQWVIDIDDGSQTVFRFLDRGATGLASSSGNPLYHGPGRGAGNSINALIDGHRLTGDTRFLAKAEELIRRCIHPHDDIERHDLLDAERRWYYTVFLQALGKYLDHKAELGQLDFMYSYGRGALLHYARWMAVHEYPYLDKPEILEYPTETWPAQDMRKSEVFKVAARHVTGSERERFLERSEFFFRYVTSTLTGMKTRTLCRPVVLLLSYGFMHSYFRQFPQTAAPAPACGPVDFGRPQVFIPQKVRAKKRLKALAVGSAALGAAGGVTLLGTWLL